MAEVRRQEFVVSLADLAANPTKVLAANEFLYVRQADGKLKMMCGDGVTAISALPYTVDIGAMEQAVIDAQAAQAGAEGAQEAASESATAAANNILNGISTHNSDTDAHQSIQSDIRTAEAALQQVASQLADMKKNHDFFHPDAIVPNKYVNGVTGQEVVLLGVCFFEMPVTPNAYYIIKGPYVKMNLYTAMGAYFNSSGQYVGNMNQANIFTQGYNENLRVIRVPENAHILKINFAPLSAIGDTHIYQDGLAYMSEGQVADNIVSDLVSRYASPYIVNLAKQLRTIHLDGAYISGNSDLSRSEIVTSIPAFPVKPGEVYRVRNWLAEISYSAMESRGVFLDSQFRFISSLPTNGAAASETPVYTVPENAAYMTINIALAAIDALVIERLSSPAEDYLIRKEAIYPPIQALANGWSGKRWVSLGDSITYQGLWQSHVIAALGLAHTNCGIGSTCLAGSATTAFWQDVRLDAVKAANPDLVTILGGANDLVAGIPIGTSDELAKLFVDKNKGNFVGAYSYIVENLLTWKPSLRIVILTTTWAHMNGTDYSASLTYDMYAVASKLVAEYYGLPCVDLYHECGFNAFTMDDAPHNVYSADHIHPNAEGAKVMASLVIDTLMRIRCVV